MFGFSIGDLSGKNNHGYQMDDNSSFGKSSITSNGGGKMDRIKPEKLPRQRVQTVWRNVRWAESFPDDSLMVDVSDITPNFALRKVALLFENKKYGECASLIRRLNCVTLSSILTEVPVEVLHDSLPQSLTILEALYTKIYETTESPSEFPKEDLHVDQLLQRMVAMFAQQSNLNNKHEKNSNSVYPSCRNILRVVTWIEPNIRRSVRQRKRALDKCVRHLGKHGLAECSEGTLMNLHDSLKIEFEKVVTQFRTAIQKLDEMSPSAKHPTGSSIAWGPAPSFSSHHRMMQLTRDDVQDRIIKNRTLFNIVEPAITNQYLKKLIYVLEKRIEYDKVVLFHHTELRKMSAASNGHSGKNNQNAFLSSNMREFSQGYATVLQLLKEVADEDMVTEDEEDAEGIISSDEEAASPLMLVDRVRPLSGMNGMSSLKVANGGSTSRRHRPLVRKFSHTGTRPSIIHVGRSMNGSKSENPLNGFHSSQSSLLSHHCLSNGGTLPASLGRLFTVGDEGRSLEQELQHVKDQVEKQQETIKHLQEREKQYIEQLSQHAPGPGAETEISRAVELISQFGQLYHKDRGQALDALNDISELKEVHSLKGKILFSVVVLAFRSVQQYIQELKGKVRHTLQMPVVDVSTATVNDAVAMEMERHIEEYLCHTADRYDITTCIQEVSSQIYATLYDYPCLKTCEGLSQYMNNCVRTAYGLSVQRPPYRIVYDSRVFQPDLHVLDQSSNTQSILIQAFLWPALLQSPQGPCVQKAIVIT